MFIVNLLAFAQMLVLAFEERALLANAIKRDCSPGLVYYPVLLRVLAA